MNEEILFNENKSLDVNTVSESDIDFDVEIQNNFNEDVVIEDINISLEKNDSFNIDADINNNANIDINTEEFNKDVFVNQVTTSDYNSLHNKPSINSVELINNLSLDDLKIQQKGDYPDSRITNSELENIFAEWN